MLLRNSMMGASKPRLQIAEDQVDHRQVSLGLFRISTEYKRVVFVAGFCQASIANPPICSDLRARCYVLLNETEQPFSTSARQTRISHHFELAGHVGDHLQSESTGIDKPLDGDSLFVCLFPLGRSIIGIFTCSYLDSADHSGLVVNTVSLPARLAAYIALIDLNGVLSSNCIAVGTDHPRSQLVEYLEGRLVAGQAQLPLELKGRHARRLRGHKIRAPEPRGKGRVGLLHDRAGREGNVALVTAHLAAQHGRATRREAIRLAVPATLGACESIRPPQSFQVLSTCGIVWKDALKFGEGCRKSSAIHTSKNSSEKELCQVTGEAWSIRRSFEVRLASGSAKISLLDLGFPGLILPLGTEMPARGVFILEYVPGTPDLAVESAAELLGISVEDLVRMIESGQSAQISLVELPEGQYVEYREVGDSDDREVTHG